MGIGDTVAMLEHSYYSVISPEGCASILWKDTEKNKRAAEVLKMHAEDLTAFGVIDDTILEPKGGAHLDPDFMYRAVKNYVVDTCRSLKTLPVDRLLERRYQKFRKLGECSEKIGE